jgi:hypothetical protein
MPKPDAIGGHSMDGMTDSNAPLTPREKISAILRQIGKFVVSFSILGTSGPAGCGDFKDW